MKLANKYHKYTGYAQKRVNGVATTYEDVKVPFKFDYYDNVKDDATWLFKGFNINTQSTKIITQQITNLKVNDKVWIDDSGSLISNIITIPVKNLSGNRFKTNKKDFVIVLEE